MSESEPQHSAYQSLSDALRTCFLILRIGIFLLVLAFLFSGTENIKQYESAVILRFGKVHKTAEPGLVFALPFPIDKIIRVEKNRSQAMSLDQYMPYKSEIEKNNNVKLKASDNLNPGLDGYLLSADRKIFHCESKITYQVSNSTDYLFMNAQREESLQKALSTALVASAASLRLDEINNAKIFNATVLKYLQEQITQVNLGIELINLENSILIPRQIETENNLLNKARNEAAGLRSEAELYAAKLANETESQASAVLSSSSVLIAQREAKIKTIIRLQEQYRDIEKKYPSATRELLLSETMQKIMENAQEIIYLDPDKHKVWLDIPRRAKKKVKTEVK